MTAEIPIHDFTKDSPDSIPFRLLPLNAGSGYDTTNPHRHNYYEIFFFTGGGGSHTVDFEEMQIRDNSLHFVSPGQVHLLQRLPSAHGSIIMFSRDFYYLTNKGSLFDFPFLNNNCVQPLLHASEAEYRQFLSLIDLLEQEREAISNNDPAILGSYLQVILLKCRQLFDGANRQPVSRGTTMFQELRKLVEENYRTERRPAVYAGRLNVTEKRLNELCKQFAGTNVGDYIKSRVLLEAKRLLSNSDNSVKEIAYFLGFDDPSYFNRFFRLNAGTAAGDFKKQAHSAVK